MWRIVNSAKIGQHVELATRSSQKRFLFAKSGALVRVAKYLAFIAISFCFDIAFTPAASAYDAAQVSQLRE
jgi:hypothetical protein